MRRSLCFEFVLILGLVHLVSCASDEFQGTGSENQAPRVWLSAAPPEGSTTEYTVHLWWGGWDPDGEILYYEYLITDNEGGIFDPADTTSTPGDYKWKAVVSNDSVFTFTADVVADSTQLDQDDLQPAEFVRSHTFFVRAVDDRGVRSPKPAYRSFTARTLSPTIDVIIPRATGVEPALVPPITTFRWTAKDFVGSLLEVQDPESVRTILVPTKIFGRNWQATLDYVRKTPDAKEWSEWSFYRAPGDSGKVWTSPHLDFGEWVFAAQVKDEAGAVSPVFDLDHNVRFLLVSVRSTGPIFTVRNPFLGTLVTSSPNNPPVIIDLPAGIPLQFDWEASASSYGGIVSGYRYGWDILDLNNDDDWDISFTPFVGKVARSPVRRFFFGTHSFVVEVIDNSGFKSRVTVTVNVVPFTMDRNLLFIDDWEEGDDAGWARSGGVLPSDGEHDAFWADMLSGVRGFNSQTDMIHLEDAIREVPIQVLAGYKAVVWNAQGAHNGTLPSFLGQAIRFIDPTRSQSFGKVTPNLAALFMAAGGKLMLCGDRIMTKVINRESFGNGPPAFPLIFRYELAGDQDGQYTSDGNDVGVHGVGEGSFAYKECCLNVLDVAVNQTPITIRRPPNQRVGPGGCAVDHLRSFSFPKVGLRATIPIGEKYSFPRLELRPEVSDPGRFYEVNGVNSDVYNPEYFHYEAGCHGVAEIIPARECFHPIYGLECNEAGSLIFGAPVAFWTSVFEDRIPDSGGQGARSTIWGFQPVFFKPAQVREAMEIILHEEWGLPRSE